MFANLTEPGCLTWWQSQIARRLAEHLVEIARAQFWTQLRLPGPGEGLVSSWAKLRLPGGGMHLVRIARSQFWTQLILPGPGAC